jgi:hypothetical protein
MDLLTQEQASRREAVRQAVANLAARGLKPHPAVLALYAQYVRAEVSHEHVQALMLERAAVLLRAASTKQLALANLAD